MFTKKTQGAVSALFALLIAFTMVMPASAQVLAGREVSVVAMPAYASADISSEVSIPSVSVPTGFMLEEEETEYTPTFGFKVIKKPSTITELMLASYENLGRFKLSFYCPCRKCNGNSHRITASGTTLTEGRTIAVDKNKIPLGSIVHIDGFGDFIAEDTGSAIKGNKIDIFVSSHAEAYRLGIRYANVYIKAN